MLFKRLATLKRDDATMQRLFARLSRLCASGSRAYVNLERATRYYEAKAAARTAPSGGRESSRESTASSRPAPPRASRDDAAEHLEEERRKETEEGPPGKTDSAVRADEAGEQQQQQQAGADDKTTSGPEEKVSVKTEDARDASRDDDDDDEDPAQHAVLAGDRRPLRELRLVRCALLLARRHLFIALVDDKLHRRITPADFVKRCGNLIRVLKPWAGPAPPAGILPADAAARDAAMKAAGASSGAAADDDDDDDDLRNAGSTTTPKARVVEYAGLYERGAAGHVSPRKLLRAQLTLCARHGVRHLDAVARRVTRRDDGAYDVAVSDNASAPDDDPHQTLRARRVLVATNAWTNFHALLPRRVKLELTTQTAIRRAVRGVPDDDRDDATSPWPCVIVKAGATPFGARAQPKLDACYFLPPTRYADGRAYAKIGHGTFFERPLFGPIEAREWYQLDDDATGDDPGHNLERRNGHPPRETRDDAFARCRLAALLARIVRTPDAAFDGPNVPIRCVIPKTATKRPYLFKADDRLGACVGCNGYAAKSSDELGRLAAHMIMSDDGDDVSWGPTIPPDAFRPVFEDDDEETLAAAAIA
mmetsp:Transcript_5553/g.23041  ORF Transcript_5553/g.23041 Transcript_5553/m.23041 type:complete len:593 (+) Transcript_5553:1040-2818(+)